MIKITHWSRWLCRIGIHRWDEKWYGPIFVSRQDRQFVRLITGVNTNNCEQQRCSRCGYHVAHLGYI